MLILFACRVFNWILLTSPTSTSIPAVFERNCVKKYTEKTRINYCNRADGIWKFSCRSVYRKTILINFLNFLSLLLQFIIVIFVD